MAGRKSSRRMRRTRRKQQGGGWGYNGPAFQPAGGMAPEAARAAVDTGCDFPERPVPQVGGACGCMAAPPIRQMGGGAGTGGYGFVMDNSMGGKVYADLTRGACPSQSGGSMRAEPVVSYPSGYGYNTASAVEIGGGSAHYLEQVPYGRQCMGGGSRKRSGRKRHVSRKRSVRRHKKSHRRR